MDPAKNVNLNIKHCTGCGLCLYVCPDSVFEISSEKKVKIVGEKCISCGHCVAVCPEHVIAISSLPELLYFKSFTEKTTWISYGEGDLAGLVQLLRSRRSCRNFLSKPVPKDLLEDLVKIGTTAPSGTNSQEWIFSILPARGDVVKFGDKIAYFYKRLNKKAKNPFLRLYAKLFLKDNLGRYYRRYYQTIASGLKEWDEERKDRLFHGATAAVLVGSTCNASCPAEDAMLATQNILIAAHLMGLGTCLIGFAVEAMKQDKTLKEFLSIQDDHSIYAVIAIGYPAEKYVKVTGRKSVTPHYPFL